MNINRNVYYPFSTDIFFYRTEDNDIMQKSMRIILNMYKFRQSQNA